MLLLKPGTKVNAVHVVHTIHCHFCGGVIRDPATIQYRPPRASVQFALSQPGPCTCTPPIVYEDSPLADPPLDDPLKE